MSRKFFVITGFGLFLIAGLAATRPPVSALPPPANTGDDDKYKNLQILPKNIDPLRMDALMENFARSIGVTCLYCHAKSKPGITPERMDFASDENPQKEIARKMMRLTARINKKYFDFKVNYSDALFVKAPMNCRTCHRGFRIPVIKNQ